jgi:hypothetical protein
VIALAGGARSLGVAHLLLRVAAVAIPTAGFRAAFPAARGSPGWRRVAVRVGAFGFERGGIWAHAGVRRHASAPDRVIKSGGEIVSAGRLPRTLDYSRLVRRQLGGRHRREAQRITEV